MASERKEGIRLEDVTEPVFSSRRAADLAGITGHQLHGWASSDVAIPSIDPGYRQGRPKKWAFSDVVGLRILRELIGAGMCPPMLRNVLPALRSVSLRCNGLRELAATRLVLFWNGDVTVASGDDQLADVMVKSTGTILRALIIELDPAVSHVEKAMRRARLDDDLDLLAYGMELVNAA